MGNWQQRSMKPWLRTVAAIVLVTFTVTSVAWADGQGSIVNSLRGERKFPSPDISSLQSRSGLQTSGIDIPSEFGEIKSAYQGLQDLLIVHIQDAHVNEEAQMNISRIIEYLSKQSKTRLVGVEGASGE